MTMLQHLRHLHPVLAEHLHPLAEVHLVGHQHAGQRARPEVQRAATQMARGSELERGRGSEASELHRQRQRARQSEAAIPASAAAPWRGSRAAAAAAAVQWSSGGPRYSRHEGASCLEP